MTEVLLTPRGTTPARAPGNQAPTRMAGRGDHPGADPGIEEVAPDGAQPPGPRARNPTNAGPRARKTDQRWASGPEDRPILIPGSGRMTAPEGAGHPDPHHRPAVPPRGTRRSTVVALVCWLTDPYRRTVRGVGFPGEFDGSPRRPDCPSPNRRTLNHRLARPSSPTVCEAHREHDHEYRPLRGSCS